MNIVLDSFGKKNHIHLKNYDLLIDARCMKNPFYVPELKHSSGLNKNTQEYLYEDNDVKEYLTLLSSFISFYLSHTKQKRQNVNIGFMCTGGFHRSVFLVEYFYEYFKSDYFVTKRHLDL